MPIALGWLSLGTVPFCYSAPFGPVNSVAHNGLLILFEKAGRKKLLLNTKVCGQVRSDGVAAPRLSTAFFIKAAQNCHLGDSMASKAVTAMVS